MEDALNDQINAELYSAYLYLAMAAYFDSANMAGFASWMRVQTQEETAHAMKIFDFVSERGGRVVLKAIEEPAKEWKSPLAAFKAAYEHEQYITGRIDDLVNLAIKENSNGSSTNRSRRKRPLTASSSSLRWPKKRPARKSARRVVHDGP